jgi:hypothetical protein
MISSTIWQVHDDSQGRTVLERRRTDEVAQGDSSPRADAGHIGSAVASALTIILMFQPWLTASGPNGRLKSDAFGRIDGSAEGFADWTSSNGYYQPSITGAWAALAALTAVMTITAVILNLRNRSDMLSYLVPGSAVATAVLVLADLLYLSGKAPELRAAVEGDHGLAGGLIDLILGGSTSGFGTGNQVANAGLDAAALLGGATAVGGAVAAVGSGLRKQMLTPVLPTVTVSSAVPV